MEDVFVDFGAVCSASGLGRYRYKDFPTQYGVLNIKVGDMKHAYDFSKDKKGQLSVNVRFAPRNLAMESMSYRRTSRIHHSQRRPLHSAKERQIQQQRNKKIPLENGRLACLCNRLTGLHGGNTMSADIEVFKRLKKRLGRKPKVALYLRRSAGEGGSTAEQLEQALAFIEPLEKAGVIRKLDKRIKGQTRQRKNGEALTLTERGTSITRAVRADSTRL